MLSYILKRLAQTVLVLFGITLITFILLNVVPGDPVAMMLDKRADEATIEKVRHEMGLDVPLPEQYVNFVKGAVRLDFGKSYFTKENVMDALVRSFKVTVKLAAMSFILSRRRKKRWRCLRSPIIRAMSTTPLWFRIC